MANKYRGEVHLEVDNVIYTIAYTSDSLVTLEGKFKCGFVKIMRMLGNEDQATFTMLRDILFEGLHGHHPEMTLEQAGDMIMAAGFNPTMEKVVESFSASVRGKEQAPANPQVPSQTPPMLGTGSDY